jgi:hypothetical protein
MCACSSCHRLLLVVDLLCHELGTKPDRLDYRFKSRMRMYHRLAPRVGLTERGAFVGTFPDRNGLFLGKQNGDPQ